MTATIESGTWPPGPADDVDPTTMRQAPLAFVERMRRYGDVTSHRVFGSRVVLLHHPDGVRHVLKDHPDAYTKEGTPDDAMLRPLLGNGLLTSNGADWAVQRQAYAPAFRRARVAAFDDAITQVTNTFLERWLATARAGAELRMDHELTSLTLSVLVRIISGADVGALGNRFGEAVDAANRFIGEVDATAVGTPQGRAKYLAYRQSVVFLDQITRTLIAARRGRTHGAPDLLGHMLQASHITSDDDLRDQVLTLIMAGHETTAKTLTWALLLLDRNPIEADAVRAEVDEVLGGRTPTAADVANLPRTRAVVAETMRIYPPVWIITRRAAADDEIGGYPVPAGTIVSMPLWNLHRDPRFHDRPEEFCPDRFLPGTPAPAAFSYLPFGGGTRVCIGQHLATLEATLVLAQLTSRVHVVVAPDADVTPQALVTLRPNGGLPARLMER